MKEKKKVTKKMKISKILRKVAFIGLKMKKTNRIFVITALLVSALLLMSCSTKKNKWNRRVWHNMTAHYNVWWNGNQSIQEGEKALRNAVKDDYTTTLPVFNYGTKEDADRPCLL